MQEYVLFPSSPAGATAGPWNPPLRLPERGQSSRNDRWRGGGLAAAAALAAAGERFRRRLRRRPRLRGGGFSGGGGAGRRC